MLGDHALVVRQEGVVDIFVHVGDDEPRGCLVDELKKSRPSASHRSG